MTITQATVLCTLFDFEGFIFQVQETVVYMNLSLTWMSRWACRPGTRLWPVSLGGAWGVVPPSFSFGTASISCCGPQGRPPSCLKTPRPHSCLWLAILVPRSFFVAVQGWRDRDQTPVFEGVHGRRGKAESDSYNGDWHLLRPNRCPLLCQTLYSSSSVIPRRALGRSLLLCPLYGWGTWVYLPRIVQRGRRQRGAVNAGLPASHAPGLNPGGKNRLQFLSGLLASPSS